MMRERRRGRRKRTRRPSKRRTRRRRKGIKTLVITLKNFILTCVEYIEPHCF